MNATLSREYKSLLEDMRGAFYERAKEYESMFKQAIKRHHYVPNVRSGKMSNFVQMDALRACRRRRRGTRCASSLARSSSD